eukprot:1429923-Prymnesium_polylepis.2
MMYSSKAVACSRPERRIHEFPTPPTVRSSLASSESFPASPVQAHARQIAPRAQLSQPRMSHGVCAQCEASIKVPRVSSP